MKNWYCIYTKPRMEEMVGSQLMTLPGIDIFSPKLKHAGLWRGKPREKTEPLFPGYLFSRFSPLDYCHLITYTRGVRRILCDPSGRPCIVGDSIIGQIQSRMEDGFVRMEPIGFAHGDRVQITHGPLKGFTGIFEKTKARDRVLILLSTIAYQASIEVERSSLARL